MTNNSRPARRCIDCNRVLTKAIQTAALNSDDMCDDCFHIAGLYNEHQDGGHDDAPVEGCEGCGHVIADRSKPSNEVAAHAKMSHADCYAKGAHDKTREGRAACRKARKG